jgi:uncharacterized protein YggE
MKKSVQVTSIIVVGVLLAIIIGFVGFKSILYPSKTVNSYGEASISVVPDLVTVYFNVHNSGDDLSEVQEANNQIVNTLKTNLMNIGFAEKDIQTQSFYIGPKYRYSSGKQIQDGYEASHSIKLEMSTDDVSKIGQVIDAGVNAGASINYINFELTQEKQNEYKAQAIKMAAEDAKIKAEALASGLGYKIGKLVSVSNSNFGYSPWNIYTAREDSVAGEAKAATTSIQPSEQEIYASVTAVFRIK